MTIGLLAAAQPAQAAVVTWDGGGADNNWSTAANWSGDVAPGTADIATFDATSVKAVTINANISVAGIDINTGYTGTITQAAGITVTVGGSHYDQAAGTFTGGDSAIDINGTFTLSGGTFTSTSGLLSVGVVDGGPNTFFSISGGTFNHNSGTAVLRGYDTDTIDVSTSLTLNNVTFQEISGDSGVAIASGDTIVVLGTLTHTSGLFNGPGTVEARGNVVISSTAEGGNGTISFAVTGDQTITTHGGSTAGLNINKPSGTVAVASGTSSDLTIATFTLASGTFTAPSGSLSVGVGDGGPNTFFSISGGTFNHNSGTAVLRGYYTDTIDVSTSLTLNNVTFQEISGDSGVAIASGDTIVVLGTLTHTSGWVNGPGTVEARGNVVISSTAEGGTAVLKFTGTANQTYTTTGGTPPANWTVASGATLDLVNALSITGTLTNDGTILATGAGTPITAGTLTTTVATSQVIYSGSGAVTVEDGTYGNVTFNNAGGTYSLSGATTVKGNWVNTAGAIAAGTQTVTFSGVNQAIIGANTFYNLSASAADSASLVFPAGTATTVNGKLTLKGPSQGNPLILLSSVPGSAALLNLAAGATHDVLFVNVKDNNASGGLAITAYDSVNSGNNTNWTFAALDLNAGLVGHWRMDNNALDATANANNGTVSGATFSTTVPGNVFGGTTHSASFDGVNDYVSVPDSTTLDSAITSNRISIALWINTTTTAAEAWLVGQYDGSAGGEDVILAVRSGTLQFFFRDSEPWVDSGSAVNNGSWRHVAGVWDGTNMVMYVGGTQVHSSARTITMGDNTAAWEMGGNSVIAPVWYNGLMDDVRLYNRALSAAEITKLAATGGGAGVLTLQDADAAPTNTTVTNSTAVTAAFTNVESGATAYVLSNTAGSFGATAAIPATPAFNATWTMSGGDGDKTVYARITKADSTTYTISDTITLDTAPPAAPSGLTLTANADNTGFTATVTAPSADVTKLHWRYVSLDGNVAASYPATHTSGTALGAGVTTGVSAGAQYTITASSMTQLKTYGVRVWAEDAAGNVSTLNAQASLYLSPPTPRLVVTAPSSAVSATAGQALTLTITAKDADGVVLTTYTGPYSLTWTPTGAAATALVSSSSAGWSAGVTTTAVTIGGASAGTGTFTATDNSGSGLTNGTLPFTFYPASLTVAADAASQTAGKAFTLTVTAKDSAGQTVTRYAGTVNLSLSATPTATKVLSVTSITVIGGTGTVSLKYPDCASTATITGKDTTYVTGVTIEGTSSALAFHPAKFEVSVGSPPPRRTVWYLSEPVTPVKVKALADDGTVTANYRGTVKFATQTGLSLPSDYAFTAGDAGVHEFTGLTATGAGAYTVSVSDSAQAAATGTSGNFSVIQANVVVAAVSGPVGTLSVPVKIVDPGGNIVPDDTTTFTVMLTEAQPNGSATVQASSVKFLTGQAQISLTDSEAEKVTVSGTTALPVLPVTPGSAEFGSSSSAYSSSFQYVTYEQAPGSYTISPYSYPAGSTSTYSTSTSTFQQQYQGTTFTAPTSYDSGVYTGLTTLQSGVYTTTPTGAYAVSPTGTYSFTSPAGSTFSYNPTAGAHSFTNPAGSTFGYSSQTGAFSFSPAAGSAGTPGSFVFSPAAMQAGMEGLPSGMAAKMGSYMSGQMPGGDFQGSMPAWMQGPPAGMEAGSMPGGMPAWMGDASGMPGWMGSSEGGMPSFEGGMAPWMMGPSEGGMPSFEGGMPAWMMGPSEGGMPSFEGGMPAWMGNSEGGMPSFEGGMPAWMGDAGGMPAWMQGPGGSEAGEEEEGDGAGAGEEGTAEDAVVSDEAASSQEAATSEAEE